jgi:hypothetical protein
MMPSKSDQTNNGEGMDNWLEEDRNRTEKFLSIFS